MQTLFCEKDPVNWPNFTNNLKLYLELVIQQIWFGLLKPIYYTTN